MLSSSLPGLMWLFCLCFGVAILTTTCLPTSALSLPCSGGVWALPAVTAPYKRLAVGAILLPSIVGAAGQSFYTSTMKAFRPSSLPSIFHAKTMPDTSTADLRIDGMRSASSIFVGNAFTSQWNLVFAPDDTNPSLCDEVEACTKLYVAGGREQDYSACFSAAPAACGYILIASQTTTETFDTVCADASSTLFAMPRQDAKKQRSSKSPPTAFSLIDIQNLYLADVNGTSVTHKVAKGSLNMNLTSQVDELCNFEGYTTPTGFPPCRTITTPPSDAINMGLTTMAMKGSVHVDFPLTQIYNPQAGTVGIRPKDPSTWAKCGTSISSVTSGGVEIVITRKAHRGVDDDAAAPLIMSILTSLMVTVGLATAD